MILSQFLYSKTPVSLFVRLWVEITTWKIKQKHPASQPLREAVSWNKGVARIIPELSVVSLFVRLWVEIAQTIYIQPHKFRQPLREAVSWNIYVFIKSWKELMSASSWGCELKLFSGRANKNGSMVSLFVRLWVEINVEVDYRIRTSVSLFVRLWVEIYSHRMSDTYYPSSASSWGCELKWLCRMFLLDFPSRQPLREAVSWNISFNAMKGGVISVSLFVRLWVEIRRMSETCEVVYVSLFVRLWVEIMIYDAAAKANKLSASSWGCELKYICFIKSWKELISQPLREAVSWNYQENKNIIDIKSQPLREAVSWNASRATSVVLKSPSASSWGCELKYASPDRYYLSSCQPLREAVSWNTPSSLALSRRVRSASSWGCELKYKLSFSPERPQCVSLFVRLWVEILMQSINSFWSERQPLREAVSWNIAHTSTSESSGIVSLFVRLWVEILSGERGGCFSRSQPLREAVSWNICSSPVSRFFIRQPLREAVSWNAVSVQANCFALIVSLFVRLWVEI